MLRVGGKGAGGGARRGGNAVGSVIVRAVGHGLPPFLNDVLVIRQTQIQSWAVLPLPPKAEQPSGGARNHAVHQNTAQKQLSPCGGRCGVVAVLRVQDGGGIGCAETKSGGQARKQLQSGGKVVGVPQRALPVEGVLAHGEQHECRAEHAGQHAERPLVLHGVYRPAAVWALAALPVVIQQVLVQAALVFGRGQAWRRRVFAQQAACTPKQQHQRVQPQCAQQHQQEIQMRLLHEQISAEPACAEKRQRKPFLPAVDVLLPLLQAALDFLRRVEHFGALQQALRFRFAAVGQPLRRRVGRCAERIALLFQMADKFNIVNHFNIICKISAGWAAMKSAPQRSGWSSAPI